MKNPEGLKARAKALRLHGLLAHWTEAVAEPAPARGWIEPLLDWEEQEAGPPKPGAPSPGRSYRPLQIRLRLRLDLAQTL
jgi:hypothetical protein